MTRTENIIRNTGYGIVSKMATLLLNFVSRTLFIYILGTTYLGINGLYSEILSLLSFAELGFGSAMTFALYKPVAENDQIRIKQLLYFYKSVYRIVAFTVAVIGLSLIPFLGSIIKGADWLKLSELQFYYVVFLTNNVVGYFVSYKYSFLNALQKNYIQTNIETIVTIVCSIAQIAVLMIWKNYAIYLLINMGLLLLSRFVISLYLNHLFPILGEKPDKKLTPEEQRPIFKDVRGLVIHQFSGVAIHSTDNILISSLSEQGITAVGLISNYSMLMNSVNGFVQIVFNSVISSFGNIVAESTTKNYRDSFKLMNFINYWVYGFCSIAFFTLIPAFITLWIGTDKLIDNSVYLLIVVNFYMQGQSVIYANARAAKGNFGKDKWWSFAQALTNLVVSFLGVKIFGLIGIYIGTICSRILYTVGRPLSTYEFLFDEPVSVYFLTYLRDFSSVFIIGFILNLIIKKYIIVGSVTIQSFLTSCLLNVVVTNALLFILNYKRAEFVVVIGRLIQMIERKVKK